MTTPVVEEEALEAAVKAEGSSFEERLATVSKWPSFLERNTAMSPTSPQSRTKPFRKSGARDVKDLYSEPMVRSPPCILTRTAVSLDGTLVHWLIPFFLSILYSFLFLFFPRIGSQPE